MIFQKNFVHFLPPAGIIQRMSDANDMELVRQFARENSEAAFTELVRRHLNLVYSVALRWAGNAGDAQDVTQAVFIILARKAASLREKTLLTGWLYETTRFTAARLLRTNARRHAREQEAFMQSTLNESDLSRHSAPTSETANVWTQLAPHLEAAMSALGERDRALLLLRFYENKSGPEAAALLGIREDAAHKRMTRAIEKLRKFFAQRGVAISSAAIAGAVSANSVQAAPVGLATSVTVAAVKGSGVTATTLTLIKTTLKIMAWTKLKTAAAGGAIALLLTGTATVVVQKVYSQTNAAKTSESSSLAFAGYATPEASIQSSLWAGSIGDFKKFLAGCTAEQAERMKTRMAGKSDDQIKREAIAWANSLTGYKITQKEVISDDTVHLHIQAKPSPDGLRTGKVSVIMKKIGNEWKQAGEAD